MRPRVLASVTSVVALAVVVVFSAGASVQPAAEVARARIGVEVPTRAQLALVVLPRAAFGSDAGAFEVEIGSGFTDNAAAADATLDPKDTAGQLARAGRIVGYDLSYSDLSGAPLVRGSGLLYVDSSLDLFRSAPRADAFLTKQVRDVQRLTGKRVEVGTRLVGASTFHVGGVGDRSVGIRTTVAMGGLRFHDTIVGFRVGALIAGVGVERADSRPADALAVRLAHALAARVRLAVAGKLAEQPVPVPPVGRKGVPPVGEPSLAAMALARADLPKGTTLSRQGYVDDDTTLGSYEREFDTSSTRSPAKFVESDVWLFRHPKEATGFMLAMRALYSSPQIGHDFAGEWGEPSLEVEQHRSLSVGDESVGLVVLMAPGADKVAVRVVIVHLRIGRVIGSLSVGGLASSLHVADVRPLADALAKRIRDGL